MTKNLTSHHIPDERIKPGDLVWMKFGPHGRKQKVTGPFRVIAVEHTISNTIIFYTEDHPLWEFFSSEDCEGCCSDYLYLEKPEKDKIIKEVKKRNET